MKLSTMRRHSIRLSLLSLATVGAACAPQADPAGAPAGGAHNTISAAERAAGWRLLFDGRTMSAWRGIGHDSIPTVHWRIEDGAIRKIESGRVPVAADGQPMAGGDLITREEFGDFEFAFEWKVSPGANSGIKYNVSEPLSLATTGKPRSAALGFEYQVLDDDVHPDGKLPSHRTGDLYDLIIANDQKEVRPVGEWNQSRIVFRGTHGEHWLNGRKIVEYHLGTPEMDAILAKGKWAHVTDFGKRHPRGRIVLQDHGDAVWYRNLKIRPL